MKIEFKKSNVRLSLLWHMTSIKIAWVNPWHVGYKQRGTILKNGENVQKGFLLLALESYLLQK